MSALLEKKSLRDFDWLLAMLAIGIVAFGTVQIRYAQPQEAYWIKQLIGLGIACVAMILVAVTDYRRLLNIAPAFYIFVLTPTQYATGSITTARIIPPRTSRIRMAERKSTTNKIGR